MRIVLVLVLGTLALVACKHPTPAAPVTCPAPKQTSDICAQVITYAKNPAGGACCQYSNPCSVPFNGPQYSDNTCSTAPSPAAGPQ